MVTLHRAPWVLPVTAPPVVDGAVLVDGQQILAVGPYHQLRGEEYHEVVDHEARILLPALINGHCHLELSGCAEMTTRKLETANMPAWIDDLLNLRAARQGVDDSAVCQEVLRRQQGDGVGLVIDIGNNLQPAAVEPAGITVDYFTELLGLSRQGTELALQAMAGQGADQQFTCHAPYSTSAELLQAVKERARTQRQLYPIHVGESQDEVDFLLTGQGRFRTFLEERGVWDGSFVAPGSGPVSYLAELGVLDDMTLCVHCVQLSQGEIELLAQTQAKVCLCPGSNRFLGVGRAPLAEMMSAGLRPCLGTDSLASNPQLSLWREMAIIGEEYPQLSPDFILAMATWHAAEALGEPKMGRLAPGSLSRFISVEYEGDDPLGFLVGEEGTRNVSWVC